MNFKNFSTKCFQYLLQMPNNLFTNISINRGGQFTTKADVLLSIPFEEYKDIVLKSFQNIRVYGKPENRHIFKLLDQVSYRGLRNPDVYSDSGFVDSRSSSKMFYVENDICNSCIFSSPSGKEYDFSIRVKVKITKLGVSDQGNDIIRIACNMHTSLKPQY